MTERKDQPERYYVVLEELLPEALLKTVEARELLDRGEAKTVNEAVERVDLSRSAYYKYKDGIFAWSDLKTRRIVTVSLTLLHRSGILSKVLSLLAEQGGNVLTIHQTIPLQGKANVIITVDTALMDSPVLDWTEVLQALEGVQQVRLIGQG